MDHASLPSPIPSSTPPLLSPPPQHLCSHDPATTNSNSSAVVHPSPLKPPRVLIQTVTTEPPLNAVLVVLLLPLCTAVVVDVVLASSVTVTCPLVRRSAKPLYRPHSPPPSLLSPTHPILHRRHSTTLLTSSESKVHSNTPTLLTLSTLSLSPHPLSSLLVSMSHQPSIAQSLKIDSSSHCISPCVM